MNKAPAKRKTAAPVAVAVSAADALATEIRQLIAEARTTAATAMNASLTLLYWRVGQRIRQEVLREMRAEYGNVILVTLSRELVGEHGQGFSPANLQRMSFPPDGAVGDSGLPRVPRIPSSSQCP